MKFVKRGGIVSVVVSGVLMVAIYRAIDVRLIAHVLRQADWFWLAIAVAMILLITFLRAVRFHAVAPRGALPGIGEALRLTFVASAFNLFAPAKSGDLIKSYFVAKRSDTSAGVAFAIVVYERACDVFGLACWCVLGWWLGRPRISALPFAFWPVMGAIGVTCGIVVSSTRAALAVRMFTSRMLPAGRFQRVRDLVDGWPDLLTALGGRRRWIVALSLLLWFTHLFQIWLFAVALRLPIPFTASLAVAAVALMAGQLPLTVSGIGARDAAFVVLLASYVSTESAAALGLLVTTRNILPPLIGAPIMGPYLTAMADDTRQWRRRFAAPAGPAQSKGVRPTAR